MIHLAALASHPNESLSSSPIYLQVTSPVPPLQWMGLEPWRRKRWKSQPILIPPHVRAERTGRVHSWDSEWHRMGKEQWGRKEWRDGLTSHSQSHPLSSLFTLLYLLLSLFSCRNDDSLPNSWYFAISHLYYLSFYFVLLIFIWFISIFFYFRILVFGWVHDPSG